MLKKCFSYPWSHELSFFRDRLSQVRCGFFWGRGAAVGNGTRRKSPPAYSYCFPKFCPRRLSLKLRIKSDKGPSTKDVTLRRREGQRKTDVIGPRIGRGELVWRLFYLSFFFILNYFETLLWDYNACTLTCMSLLRSFSSRVRWNSIHRLPINLKSWTNKTMINSLLHSLVPENDLTTKSSLVCQHKTILKKQSQTQNDFTSAKK